jgi:predicted nucleic acid-binding protein
VKAFIDSDVLIWHLRGKREALDLLIRLRDKERFELWTGAMQRAEVVFFMRPEEERDTLLFLSQLQTAAVDQRVIDLAGNLYRRWNPSDGMDVNDALLAACAIDFGGRIYTLNTKHFPLADVLVEKAWDE